MVSPVNNPHPNVALDVSGIEPAPLTSSSTEAASAVTFSDSDSIGSHSPPLRNRLVKKFKLTKPTKLFSSIKKSISNKTKRNKYSMEKPCEPESVELKSYITESEKPTAEIHNIDFSNPLKTCDGREYKINQLADGKTELLISRPPITRLVFSGGGAKGVGLPGAIIALNDNELLGDIKSIYGTSIGSTAAAFVASGMTPQRYKELTIDLDFYEGLDHKKIGSKGRGLEHIVESNVRKALLNLNYKNDTQDQKDKLQQLLTVLLSGKEVTFADLKLASELSDQVKDLNIAITVYVGGKAQSIICNAETTPDLPIARACRYSASLPVVFKTLRGNFPQLEKDPDLRILKSQLKKQSIKPPKITDGGVLLNTPIPEFYSNQHTTNPIQREQGLIFCFDPLETKIPKKGGLVHSAVEKFVQAPMNSEWYRMMNTVKNTPSLRAQYIQVPLTTDAGVTVSTLDFSVSKKVKEELVDKLQEKVTQHLERQNTALNRYIFESKEEALFALGELLPDTQETASMLNYIQLAKQVITDSDTGLIPAIRAFNTNPENKESFWNCPDIKNQLIGLASITQSQEQKKWLAWYLNDHSSFEIKCLILKLTEDKQNLDFPFLDMVMQEAQIRSLHVKKQNIMQQLIYPSRYKYGQTKKNLKLLEAIEIEVNNATTEQEIDNALDKVIAGYKFRYNGALRKNLEQEAQTISIAKKFKTN